jgi:protein O-GlcNAc transferase
LCENKYSVAYIAALQDGRQSYCGPSASQSSFDCFSTQITDSRKDSFCIASNASFSHNQTSTSFKVDCTTDVPLDPNSFPKYMYETGPNYILSKYFSNLPRKDSFEDRENALLCHNASISTRSTILLKREGAGNLWHSLLEIFSLYITMDVLRTTPRNTSESSAQPFLSSKDISSTQILLLDEHPDGPYFDLWKLFAPLPIVRLRELPSNFDSACMKNVIIPLPGGSNPLWQGDWTAGACTHSVLLDVYVERILTLHGIGGPSASHYRDAPTKLILTFIDRKSSRVLLNAKELFNKVQTRFPNVHMQAIDLAALPFAEQLKIMQGTDILVGVHGAGLTHSIFLPAESSVVEILPYGLDYRVFRNLAKLRGHLYFSAHAENIGGVVDHQTDWHGLDVRIEEDRFLELVEAGVRAVLNKGSRSEDVL